MAFVFVVTTAAVSLAVYIIMSKTLPYFRTLQKKLDVISRITRENISGARVVRAFSRGEREEKRFLNAVEDYTETALNSAKISALLSPLTYIIVNLAIVVLIWLSGSRVESGSLSQGELIALVNYMLQMLTALLVVANLFVIFTKASASASRINEVFETQTSIEYGENDENNNWSFEKSMKTVNNTPAIEFENVFFKYTKSSDEHEKYALSDISFRLMPAMTMGIIGATGCGKSTLISLIPRFYDADSGKISIMGCDVRDFDLKTLRRVIGVVPQKASLVSGTIEENLRWGNPAASDDVIWKAVETAQAYDIIKSKPDGLKAPVVQGARNLSGGQKQRLTIARALVSEPEILILDDSASALDFATDAALRKSLKSFNPDMTQIIVSQRISSVRHADMILVLDNGRISGAGTHDQLLHSCEIYKEIYNSQTEEKEAKSGGDAV
ncbi:atp-binding cassette sub-family b [Holotrichia oblita]|nr:atp-binding cassette sub-family b [Holotrichia oblita]